jgi:hypothetical protein
MNVYDESGDEDGFEDQQLVCVECHQAFPHSARDRRFYAQMQFSAPKRWATCRAAKKARCEAAGR